MILTKIIIPVTIAFAVGKYGSPPIATELRSGVSLPLPKEKK